MKRGELRAVLTADERRELCHIEQGVREQDGGFIWRFALLQGMLRWAGPGRPGYVLILAVVAAALPKLVAVTGRLLMAAAWGAAMMEPMAVMALGCAVWDVGQAPDQGASPAPSHQHCAGTDRR